MSIVSRGRLNKNLGGVYDAKVDSTDTSIKGYLGASQRQAAYQTVPYAATITLDPTAGLVAQIGTLTGNLTLAAPTSPQNGDRLTILLTQDATGGRVVTWDAAFANTVTVDTTPNATTASTMVYSGGVWRRQISAPDAVDYGNLAASHDARDRWEGAARDVITNRAVVALRFDDTPSQDYANLLPLLAARSLPATFAVPRGKLDTTGYMTTAQALEMQSRGVEMAAHSRTHGSDPADLPTGVDEIVTANAELRALGFNTAGFIQPGTWTSNYLFDTAAKMETPQGRLFRANYGWMAGYRPDDYQYTSVRPYPTQVRFGSGSDGGYYRPLADNKSAVDNIIRFGGRFCTVWHMAQIDTTNNGTTADLIAFLDYVKAKRDAGYIDVVPLSTVMLGRPGIPFNMLPDGDLLLSSTGSYHPSWSFGGAGPTITPGAGFGGSVAVTGNSYATYLLAQLQAQTVRFIKVSGYAKSNTAGTPTQVRILIDNFNAAGTRLTRYDTRNASGMPQPNVIDTWTPFYYYSAVQAGAARVDISFMNPGSGSPDVLYSKLNVQKLA